MKAIAKTTIDGTQVRVELYEPEQPGPLQGMTNVRIDFVLRAAVTHGSTSGFSDISSAAILHALTEVAEKQATLHFNDLLASHGPKTFPDEEIEF